MWTEIDAHITQITGEKFHSAQRRSVGGGCINQGYAISDGKLTYFVKLNQASQVTMFEAEALGLEQIYNTGTIRVPKPICSGIVGSFCYLVLEWLEMGSGNAKTWEEMGRKLAAMHKATTVNGFGWDMNNTIGSTPQINTWTSNWADFF
ncbi:hypothetical protein CBP16_08490, partial [Fischerella thermalis WC217]